MGGRFEHLRSWAHAYVRNGLAVIPLYYLLADGTCSCGDTGCGSKGKHPWRGRLDWDKETALVKNASEVDAVWADEKYPFNLGLICDQSVMGSASRGDLLVVHANGGEAVDKSLPAFGKAVGGVLGFPKTRTAITPTGGRHLFFKIPSGWRDASVIADRKAFDDYPGLSLIAKSGYVVSAPSMEKPGHWRWQDVNVPIADAPEGFLAYLQYEMGGTINFEGKLSPKSPWYRGLREPTDLGNARLFVDRYHEVVRYSPETRWGMWSGRWYAGTESLEFAENQVERLSQTIPDLVMRTIKPLEDRKNDLLASGIDKDDDVIKELNAAIKKQRDHSSSTANGGRIDTALRRSKADPRIVVRAQDWDADKELFGAPNGIVDLRTGKLHSYQPEFLITRSGNVTYDPGAEDKQFSEFIKFVTGDDWEYASWLQKAIGLTMTGYREDLFFLVYGQKATGKSTFLDLMMQVMGSYAISVGANVIAEKKGRSSSTNEESFDAARMLGHRMLYASELPSNSNLKSELIKPLTGDGVITGRVPRGMTFEIPVTMQLWIGTNHLPYARDDDAIWRRVRVVPVNRKPPVSNPSFRKRMLLEDGPAARAALRWAVDGALEYLRDPTFGACAQVEEATEQYQQREDVLTNFLESYYDIGDPTDFEHFDDCYGQFVTWCTEQGMRSPWLKSTLQQRMLDAGWMHPDDAEKVFGIRFRTGPVKITSGGSALRIAPPDRD